jgi:hypothetical protein
VASGRTDSASAFAPALSTGLLPVPSHTTNHRWLAAPAGPGGLTTPAQIWPFGLEASLNFTS